MVREYVKIDGWIGICWRPQGEKTKYQEMNLPGDICSIVDNESGIILMVRDMDILLQVIDLGVSNVCAVQERAEKQDCEDRKDSDYYVRR